MKVIGYMLSVVFFGVFGPVFMAVSWNRTSVECARVSERVDCQVSDAYLFGIIDIRRTAVGVQSVSQESSPRDLAHDELASRVEIVAENGRIPVGLLSSNFGGSQKTGMVLAIRRFLSSSDPTLSHFELTVSTPFLIFSIPSTALFLFALISPTMSLRGGSFTPAAAEQRAYAIFTSRQNPGAEPLKIDWPETFDAAMTSPVPDRLPIVLTRGHPILQTIGKYLTLGVLVIVLGQSVLFALGYLGTWMEIVIGVVFLKGALYLTRQRRIELHRHRVAVSYTGWLAPRDWEEPIAHYTHVRVYPSSETGGAAYQAELVHRSVRKRHLTLWFPPVSREAALERAERYRSLLGVSVDTSKIV